VLSDYRTLSGTIGVLSEFTIGLSDRGSMRAIADRTMRVGGESEESAALRALLRPLDQPSVVRRVSGRGGRLSIDCTIIAVHVTALSQWIARPLPEGNTQLDARVRLTLQSHRGLHAPPRVMHENASINGKEAVVCYLNADHSCLMYTQCLVLLTAEEPEVRRHII